ncbi:dolichyl-phosphate-mannose--protein mannosyltransferase [Actinokineospora sp. PR83]|uniref:dolichyl-phosphate-mannose--protein mannosyltransferase n=1 Tax=Actinokineospora sp. PR83 TaxID=2884908 RepID=UPI0035ABB6FB
MPTDRLRGWLVTAVIGVIGAVVRFQNLGSPTDNGTPVFDEKHYTPQAWQMLRNGGVEDNPGYELTVHPPLGKTFIALGEWLFGYSGWGWRFTAALCGTLMIILVVRIARRLTRSTLLGALAGILLIADGVSHLQSRMGMLDIFLAFLILASFACVLVDRDQVRSRLAAAADEGWVNSPGTGPVARFFQKVPPVRWLVDGAGPRLGVRWWRLGAGVLLGLACGVKWSGMYYIAAFGLLTVMFDVAARRAAGVRHPWRGAIVRDVLPGLWAFVVLGVVAYLSTWWAWFGSETAIDRTLVATTGTDPLSVARGALGSLFQYSTHVLDFHASLVTKPGQQHPWESKPWTWPMSLRPMLYYYEGGTTGCGETRCVSATMLIGTPALWWLSLPMLAWGLWRMFARLDWRYAAVVVGYLTGLLPWFATLDRQMYFFYATPMAAFLVLGITLCLGQVLGAARAGAERRGTGLLVVALYVGLVVANFAWLWPILNGDPITESRWQAELWLPSWR